MRIDPDDVVVLCNRVADGPSGVPGSGKERCCLCGQQVWLSPATRTTVERASADYKILCIHCGAQQLRENPDDKLMPPSAEQIREIAKGLADLN